MYIVVELQANNEGKVANLVTSYNTLAEAQNKYFTILAAAAVSKVTTHSAVILDHCGNLIANDSFAHLATDETVEEVSN